jgi:TolB-like protein/Flp pilus assembly protein TadD
LKLEMSGERGASVSVSQRAMDVLLVVADLQPRSVALEEIESRLQLGDDEVSVPAIVRELTDAISNDLKRPDYIEVFENRVRLTTSVELAGQGRFSGLIALWNEVRKRRVFRVATTYALVTFILLQIADAVLDTLPIPSKIFPIMLAALAIGFPIVILLAWFFEVTPQGIFLDRRRTDAATNRTVAASGVILLTGIAIGFAYAVFTISEFERPVAGQDLAIAVLPFDNMSGITEDQDISDGIVEELLNELTRIKELRVVGRKASFYYRDRNEDWGTIAANLGANLIIEGSIRRSSGTMRIAAQLIDQAGYHLWSNTFDAPVGKSLDILDIQKSIAQQVVEELPIELSAESRRVLASMPTTSEEAYQLYLQGRSYLRNADQEQRFESAELLFRDALKIDAQFVRALSGLCETQALIYQRTLSSQDYARAAATCSRLITQDELTEEGYYALGTLNRLSGNYEEAKELFQTALEVTPGYEPALYGLARAVEGLGQYEEAEQFYLQSMEAEPGYWQVYNGYGRYLERGGRFAEAIEQYQRVIKLSPDNVIGHSNLGAAYFDSGQWDEALNSWQTAVGIEPDAINYMNLGTAQYYLGNHAEAEASFRAGIDIWPNFYPLWGKLGAALERQGSAEESRDAYEKAVEYALAVLEINQKDARAMYYLASYLAHLGRFAEAVEWSQKAREIVPRDPAAHYFAAIVDSLAGNDDAAVDSLAEALQLGYPVRTVREDVYFQRYLDSATLTEWMQGEAL